jgi:bifunctional non-homologous end joining protein LigD
VYVDAIQNGQGKVLASPLCVRPYSKAPVSMPLDWAEVGPGLSPRQYTIRDAVQRLESKGDPMAPVRTLKPDLAAVLGKLATGG